MLTRLKRSLQGPKRDEATPVARLPYPSVELTFWSPPEGVNFGDFLSVVIVDLMLARKGMTRGDGAPAYRQLLAIGSTLHFAEDGAVIWGSGVNGKIPAERHRYSQLDVRAVRGPLTREFLLARGIPVPEVYGDPALLLPALTAGRFMPSRDLGPDYVPTLNDLRHLGETDLGAVPVISPMLAWNECVARILRHSLVLASSLHGIIVAEAFGVPARYVRLTEREGMLKYDDYYAGTGRPKFRLARSIAEGLEMGGERPPVFDPAPLLSAFPYDLWTGH
jgi:pyruvyltransferase